MKRRILSVLALLVLLASMALPMAAAAQTDDDAEETVAETTEETTGESTDETTEKTTEETTEETDREYSTQTSGTCGKNLTWRLEGHTLIISGSGKMDNGCPWEFYKDSIHTLILDGDITHIGEECFSSCNNLKYIDFGDALVEIGYRAFYSCNALEAIAMPASFRKFEKECFMDCDSLQIVFCEGPMPSFRGSCMYTNHTVQVFYSAEVPWPYEETSRLVSNFGGRIHVDIGSMEAVEEFWEDASFEIPREEAAPVTEATEPETVATEPPVAATEPPMPTAVPTIPEVEPVATTAQTLPAETVPQTQEASEFVLESEPLYVTEPRPSAQDNQEQEEPGGLKAGILVLIIAAALTGILVLALVIRMMIHSTGRYED